MSAEKGINTRMARDRDDCWHDYGGVRLMPAAYAGHSLYVRKGRSGDAVDGQEHIRALDGIVLPEKIADRSQWVEVLALGPNVGGRCSKVHARQYRLAWVEKHGMQSARVATSRESLVGALVYIPVNDDPRIKQSPMSPDEFFIEESLPLVIMPKAA